MILSDLEIAQLCECRELVTPFDPAMINPASIDVRLGDSLLIESAQGPGLVPYPLHGHSEQNPYLLQPGQFVLASTLETFNMPLKLCGRFMLKSSRAREGLQHLLAGWLDPGWHGSVLTMELKNIRQLHPISLWPGMRIGQVAFSRMSQRPAVSYAQTGRYNHDRTVQGSRG